MFFTHLGLIVFFFMLILFFAVCCYQLFVCVLFQFDFMLVVFSS